MQPKPMRARLDSADALDRVLADAEMHDDFFYGNPAVGHDAALGEQPSPSFSRSRPIRSERTGLRRVLSAVVVFGLAWRKRSRWSQTLGRAGIHQCSTGTPIPRRDRRYASHAASENSSRPGGLRAGSPPSPPPRSIRPTVRRLPRSPRLSGPGPHYLLSPQSVGCCGFHRSDLGDGLELAEELGVVLRQIAYDPGVPE